MPYKLKRDELKKILAWCVKNADIIEHYL